MKWVMHRVGMRVRVGRVRRMRVVVGGVSQRWMMMPVSCSLSSSGGSLHSLSCSSLCCQTSLIRSRPVGLRDDNVGVLEESSGAEAVIVH